MFRELGLGALAIVATTLGLLIIAVFYEAAIDMADSWWTWIIGLGVATAAAVIGVGIIYAAMAATIAVAAVGWAGMLTGRVPAGFGPGDHNLARALGGLALFGLSAWAGTLLYRAGVQGGQLNWSVEGLFLVGAGALFGLMAALPRLYFAARARGNPVQDRRRSKRQGKRQGKRKWVAAPGNDDVALLFTLGLVAVALSMCTANSVVELRSRDGVVTLAYADWSDGCVDAEPTFEECTAQAEMILVPRRATRLRLEYLANCNVTLSTADGGPVTTLGVGAMKRMGVDPGGHGERFRRIFDAEPGATYRVRVEPTGADLCSYSVRYLDEPVAVATGAP